MDCSVSCDELKVLVTFHRIFGISYHNYRLERRPLLKRILLLWNLFIYLFLICNQIYIILSTLWYGSIFIGVDVQKSRIITILNVFCHITDLVMMVTTMLVFLLRGEKILNNIDRRLESARSRKVSLVIAAAQICSMVIFCLAPLYVVIDDLSLINTIINDIFYFLYLNLKLSVLSLMAYQSYAVAQRLQAIADSFVATKQIQLVHKQIQTARNYLKSLDRCLNVVNLMAIVVDSMRAVFVLFTIHFQRATNIGLSCLVLIETLGELIALCLLSNHIQRSYVKLLERLERLESEYSDQSLVDYALINRLYSMREDFCFTAFNMYRIDSKTFVTALTQIVTFAVILIQTSTNSN